MQRWTLRLAATYLNTTQELLGRTVHHTTIWRVLKRHALRPHKVTYFLHIRDEMFIEKMHHILAVYKNGSKHVYCFDECPNIQALTRGGPDCRLINQTTNREFEYQRNGTTDLFAFLHVHTGKVAGYCRPTHGADMLVEVFSDHVRSLPQNDTIHYICDNLVPHFSKKICSTVADLSNVPCPSDKDLSTGEKRRQWLQREDKRIIIHFLPFHGSWLNQVEIWFGLMRRYTLVNGWFNSVDALKLSINSFIRTWNEELAHPFDFSYTGKGLEGIILRRFTRILSANSSQLKQVDSKFLADLSLLCIRLIKHHRESISDHDLVDLITTIKEKQTELYAIINAESGPVRKQRAQEAFSSLCKCTALHFKSIVA